MHYDCDAPKAMMCADTGEVIVTMRRDRPAGMVGVCGDHACDAIVDDSY